MKNVKWSSIIVSICYIIAGIFFFADASLTKDVICNWIGYALLAVGIMLIISYFIRPKHESFLKNEFRDGLIAITIGLLPLIRRDIFIELVYIAIAIVIMISGYKKLQDCVDSWRLGMKNGLVYFILAAISIILGLIIMLDPTIQVRPLHNLIGAGLLYSGASDLISTIFLSSKMIQYINTNNIEKEVIEEENEENKTPEN